MLVGGEFYSWMGATAWPGGNVLAGAMVGPFEPAEGENCPRRSVDCASGCMFCEGIVVGG